MITIETRISEELKEKIGATLYPEEQIHWMGVPDPVFFTSKSVPPFLFAIPLTAFSILWICGASGFRIPNFDDPGFFFPFFGLPFLLAALGLLSAPLWAFHQSLNTVYLVTSHRAIVFDKKFLRTRVRSYVPGEFRDIHRRDRSTGRSDVIFAKHAYVDADGDSLDEDAGFFRIAEPGTVEALLHKLVEERNDGLAAAFE